MSNLGKQSKALYCTCYADCPNHYRRDGGKRCREYYARIRVGKYPAHPNYCIRADAFKLCLSCAKVFTCKEVLKASKSKEPLCIWGCTEYEENETTYRQKWGVLA